MNEFLEAIAMHPIVSICLGLWIAIIIGIISDAIKSLR